MTNFAAALDTLQGNTTNASSVAGGQIQLNTGLAADLAVTGAAGVLTALGLSAAGANTAARSAGPTSTPAITAATKLAGTATPGGADVLVSALTAGDYLVVNNKTITFHTGGGDTGSIATNDLSIDLSTATVGSLLGQIDTATGGSHTVTGGGAISLTTSTGADISFTGSLAGTLTKLGLSGPINRGTTGGPVALSGATLLSGAASTSSNALTHCVRGWRHHHGQRPEHHVPGVRCCWQQPDQHRRQREPVAGQDRRAVGFGPVVVGQRGWCHHPAHRHRQRSSHHDSNSGALSALGLGSGVSQPRGTGASPLNGLTLSIGATGGGATTNITFGGVGAGHVNTLNDLNQRWLRTTSRPRWRRTAR